MENRFRLKIPLPQVRMLRFPLFYQQSQPERETTVFAGLRPGTQEWSTFKTQRFAD